jgi:hypothetical protein
VAPIARHDVLQMFAPRDDAHVSRATPFLDLHYDAWLHAAISMQSPPPIGSLLHHLLQTHNINFAGPSERLNYGDLVQSFASLQK